MKFPFRAMLRSRMARFLVVGVAAALLLFALSYLLASLGAPPFAGNVVAYAVAFAVAYTAQRAWTFGARHDHRHALPRYFILQGGCALLSGVLAHLLVKYLQLSPFAMSAFTTLVASTASYVLSTRWAFAESAQTR